MKASWIPSPLVPAGGRPDVPIVASRAPSRWRPLAVLGQFVVVAAVGLGVALRLTTVEHFARRLRRLFERLGGLWIKAGQVLALRIDLLPEALCVELSHLQSRSMGFPGHEARAIVEAELGGPLDQWFDEWEERPLASASIGQVHRAHLRHERTWVAVKVQKPYSAELFASDLRVMAFLVWLANRLHIYPHMQWADGLAELRQIMREELDFGFEAGATRRMRRQLRPHGVHVPKVYAAYSTSRVLVLEFLDMVLMADYLRVAREDPERLAAWRQDNGIRPHVLGRRLIYTFQRQLLEDNYFHGDMHPGNIGLLRDNRIALIDFGSTNFTDLDYLRRFRLLMATLATGHFAKGADMCLMLCASLPAIDLGVVHGRIVQVMQSWAARTWVPQLPFHDKSMGRLTMDIMQVLLGHQCAMEWAWLRIHRASSTLDASIIELAPGIDYRRITARVFALAAQRRVEAALQRAGARRALGTWVETLGQPAKAQEYLAAQVGLIRRQVQAFKGVGDSAGRALTALVDAGRLVVLVQVLGWLASLAPLTGLARIAPRAFEGLAGQVIGVGPEPRVLWPLLMALWAWTALSRLRSAITDGALPLPRQRVA